MELGKIKEPSFLKQYNIKELEQLSSSIRAELINIIADKGGHLSSNLGVIELTIGLHYVFDFNNDKLLFDIGHQSYTHKILTGRYNDLKQSLRQFKGISGYQKIVESSFDHFEAGHAATALAAASGMVKARELNNQHYEVVALVGDGGLASGLSFEALNNLSLLNSKLIIILNDNDMSISKPIGNIAKSLNNIRQSRIYQTSKNSFKQLLKSNSVTRPIYKLISSFKALLKRAILGKNIFENFNLKYLGPIDGHDFKAIIKALDYAKKSEKSIVIHFHTKKGKGYEAAEIDKSGKWHGVDKFSNESIKSKELTDVSWSKAVADNLAKIMSNNNKVYAITPAMTEGSKLNQLFQQYPTRTLDVGINEEFAFTFASGLALSGYLPFISIYSTFLQRSFDQVLHDNARLNNNLVIGVDRAGLVGQDGDTHHGIYDVAFLKSIPNTIIAMPSDESELTNILDKAFNNGLFFIRYPRGKFETRTFKLSSDFSIGQWEKVIDNKVDVNLIVTGPIIHDLAEVIKKENIKVNLIYARFYHPIDQTLLSTLNGKVIVYDIYSTKLGLFESIASFYASKNQAIQLLNFSLENQFYTHGKIEDLLIDAKLDLASFIKTIKTNL